MSGDVSYGISGFDLRLNGHVLASRLLTLSGPPFTPSLAPLSNGVLGLSSNSRPTDPVLVSTQVHPYTLPGHHDFSMLVQYLDVHANCTLIRFRAGKLGLN